MYINKEEEILNILSKEFSESKEILISVSYITFNGFSKIIDKVNTIDKKIKIVTTTDDYITDYDFLKKYSNNKNITIKLLNSKDDNDKKLHTKFIIFKKEKLNNVLLIGSLNLTHNALFKKYEAITLITQKDKLAKALDDFNYLWNRAIFPTNEWINSYKDKHDQYQIRYKETIEKINRSINIEPNKMQRKVLEELNELRNRNEYKALLWAATGSGKTILSAFDSKIFKFKKMLFIVHNRVIINSAIKDFKKIFHDKKILELYPKNRFLIKNNDIVFSTEKTMINILLKEKFENVLNEFDYFIFDEAHKIGKKAENEKNKQLLLLEKIEKLNSKKFILGMTATPFRTDDPAFLSKQFNKNIIGKINIEKAIKEKLISDFNYYGKDIDLDFNLNKSLTKENLYYLVNIFLAQLKKIKIWREEKYKGILFLSKNEEANIVAERLTNLGYDSIAIHSRKNENGYIINNEEITSYIEELQNDDNSLNFLVTVNKFNEGVDIPLINTIGMLRFTESNIIYSQQIGRGLRKIKKDGKEKYLNIIDLIGNYKNNFNRIPGLMGEKYINPKKYINYLQDSYYKNENFLSNFEITKIAKEKIFNSLNKINFEKYFKYKISEKNNFYNEKLNILNIEKKLKEQINIIINNLQENKTYKKGNKYWLKEIYNLELNDDESALIELFSWLPFTITTTKEKEKILNLLSGKNVKFNEKKWYSYFLGRNVLNNKKSQIINYDFSNYFFINKNGENIENIKFSKKINSDNFLFLIKEIKKYLYKNKNKNDFLNKFNWYCKLEISFMADYLSIVRNGKFKKYNNKNDENYFLVNKLNKGIYKNEILSNNEFLLSSDKENDNTFMGNEKNIYFFVGSNLFQKKDMFKYIGKKNENILRRYDKQKREIDNNKYDRYYLKINHLLSAEDFKYMHISNQF